MRFGWSCLDSLLPVRQQRPIVDHQSEQSVLTAHLTGYDTTLATSQWLVKLITLNPRVQEKLRSHLRAAFAHHVENGTMPTAAEIAATEMPYLDATVEEVARLSDTTGAQVRVALKDTEVLGHYIPKGTDVFMIVSLPCLGWPQHNGQIEAREEICC